MHRASEAVAKLDQALTDPQIFAKDPQKAAALGRQREEAQAKLAAYAADYNRRMLVHCPAASGKQ